MQGLHMKKESHVVAIVATIAALAGLLFGYDTGVISGALLFIKHTFPMQTSSIEMVVSSVLIGAMLGAIISGSFSDRFGRRSMMLSSSVAFIVGTLLCAIAYSVVSLMVGRLIVGFAIGVASYTAPLYISEIAPKRVRGALVIINTIMVTGGIVLAYVVDLLLSPLQAWRWMLGLGVVPAILLAVGLLFLPNSPRWMAQKGWLDGALRILKRLRPEAVVQEELNEIKRNVMHHKNRHWRMLFQPGVRSLLLMGVGLAVVQQITGINTILYYAPYIFKSAGFTGTTSVLFATLGMGVTNFVFTIIAMLWVDRLGRRKLLLIGLTMMTLSLLVVSALFYSHGHGALLRWSSVIGLILFVAFYALSIGCLFWLIISEVFPLRVRSVAMSVAATANWLANFLVALTFLTLLSYLGPANTFFVYAVAGLVSIVFAYQMVPETKNISLEHIEENIKAGCRSREVGVES